jgi:DNA polymerase V
MKQHIFMLVDAMQFYVSCERVFRAALHNRPTIILSNNDGCIVALSPEAKALGLKRGQPLFQCQKIVKTHNVQVFSSNYALYGSMSRRFHGVLAEFSPRIERYSIDEAWLELTGMDSADLTEFGHEVKRKVRQFTGLPVRISIAPTKELTKIACELLKDDERYEDVLDLTAFTDKQLDNALAQVPIEAVWGIGSRYAQLLHNYGIHSAKDLKYADERWIKHRLTVVGARIQMELKGISCIPLEEKQPKKQEIICAKSFGHEITSRTELLEAVATYTARVAEKLREQDSLAGQITVFVRTNPFASNLHYANEFTIDLPHPTDYTPQLLKQARACLKAIYRKGHRYDKAGVILSKITPLHLVQPDLFGEIDLERHYQQARFMAVTDAINRIFGRGTLIFATQGLKGKPNWRMRQERLSSRYTSRWDEILTI